MKYNGCLRGVQTQSPPFFRTTFERLCSGNTYAATIRTINNALVRLAPIQRIQKVFRGIAGQLPKALRVEDKFGARGAVELGFMSVRSSTHLALPWPHCD